MTHITQHVSTLIAAMKFNGNRSNELGKLTDAQWKDLLLYCDMSHLTIAVGLRLKNGLPEWVQQRIEQNIADNTARFERIKLVYREIAEEFSRSGVDHLVLKGFAQWPARMQHPRFRMQSDIDLYCASQSCASAMDALTGLGYREVASSSDQHLPPLARPSAYRWRGNFFDPEMPVSIEIHSRFWNSDITFLDLEGTDKFWCRRTQADVDEMKFASLSPIDCIGYAGLHAFRHLLYGYILTGHLYEIAWFLQSTVVNQTFWRGWKEYHGNRLRMIEAVAFTVAEKQFECELPEEVGEEIAALSRSTRAEIQRYTESAVHTLFRPNKDFICLLLSLIDSAKSRRTAFFKYAFGLRIPSAAQFENRDPTRQQGPIPGAIPKYYRFARYSLQRLVYHGKQLPRLLINGLRWWWSTKGLDIQFWTFYTASFCFDLGMFVFFFLFNLFLLDVGFNIRFLGLVTSVMAAGNIAGTLPAGWLAQRLGLRKTLLVCFSSIALSLASRAVFMVPLAQLCLAFLGGMASSIWAVCISPALAQLTTERNRAFGFSLVFSFGIGEGVLGGLIGGNLPGWLQRIVHGVSATEAKRTALLIAATVVVIGLFPVSRLKFSDIALSSKKIYCRRPFLMRFLVAIGLWSLVTGAFSPFFNAFFVQHLKVPLSRLGTISAMAQLSQVIAILAAPYIFKRFGLVHGIVQMQIATAVSLVGLAMASGPSTAALSYVTYMAFLWMSEPGMYSLLMNQLMPAEWNGASSLNFLVISVAQMFAALIASFSFDRYGYPLVLSLLAIVAVISAGCFRLLITENPGHRLATGILQTGLD